MIDELLVHISAPTTRQSDELYQSLAEAYLEFEPHGIRPEFSQQNNASSQFAPSELNAAAAPNQSSFRGTGDTSVISTYKDSYGSFPSYLSFDGAKAPADASGRFGYDGADDLPPTSSQLELVDRTGRGQRSINSSSSSKNQAEDLIPSSPDDTDMGFIEDSQVAVGTPESQLEDRHSMAFDGTTEIEPDEDIPDDTVANTEHDENRANETMEISVAATPDTNDAIPQRRRSLRLKAASSTAAPSPATTKHHEPVQPDESLRSSMPASQDTTNAQEVPVDNDHLIDFSNLQVDVYPPEPNVSIARPGTLPSQITAPLATLKEQNPTRFKPIRVLKKPKADDRGYWLVGCSHWPAHLQQVFWTNVCEQVSSGRLGWGVALYREGFTARSLGRVKLYCWGEVVEHIWLVLWLCSKGQVSGSGLKWIDADRNEAFVMR